MKATWPDPSGGDRTTPGPDAGGTVAGSVESAGGVEGPEGHAVEEEDRLHSASGGLDGHGTVDNGSAMVDHGSGGAEPVGSEDKSVRVAGPTVVAMAANESVEDVGGP